MKKMRYGKLLCGALCSALFLGSAAADTVVQVKEVSLGNGMNSGSLTLPLGTANFWAGFQNITVQDGASTNTFLAFCLDPYQWSSGSYTTYTQTTLDTTFSAAAIEKVVDLYNYGYSNALSSNLGAAALQVALWEVVNDNSTLALSLIHI